ncbi:NAD(P)H-dependent oxidoreductase [Pseudodesulfovibrio sp.]|uniref:flavodoxin family protein n=1 Tax=Pseudodesulfovibrio sp. TaxID=2035812 RepID=UPI00260E4353|nr:NAD(P)H-dependent oxidoreductase [Pseudodesulfovibrio sp.]MDD3311907.1 NAD(P)H-dependent oxidoreductase [Pseudodesulfovibrio sp.]
MIRSPPPGPGTDAPPPASRNREPPRHIGLFNGSPRRKDNTATRLEACREGAQDARATADPIRLYSLDYKGCASRFRGKRAGGRSYGVRAMKDGLSPLLRGPDKYDAIVLGAPVHFGAETAMTRKNTMSALLSFAGNNTSETKTKGRPTWRSSRYHQSIGL